MKKKENTQPVRTFTSDTPEHRDHLRATVRSILNRMVKDAEMQTPTSEGDAVFFALLSLTRIAIYSDMNTREYALICAEEIIAPELEAAHSVIDDLTSQMLTECRREVRANG